MYADGTNIDIYAYGTDIKGLLHICDLSAARRDLQLVTVLDYGMATISRLLKIIGLFCRI